MPGFVTVCPLLPAALLLLGAPRSWGAEPAFPARLSQVVRALDTEARAQVEAGHLSGVSLALVQDQEVVWATGWGWADEARRIPATPTTVYRAGSISKVFTAVAVMQLAERGKLALDQPVHTYVPEFRPVVPFEQAPAITLRHLMAHRSGLPREPPVGGTFDDSEPGLLRTVASLADGVLVFPPGTKTKYSNGAWALVGMAVHRASGTPFAKYMERAVFQPLHMSDSGFAVTVERRRRLAVGNTFVAQSGGGVAPRKAPVFDFGATSAANLYTTAEDLGRFLVALHGGGPAPGERILRPETLQAMFEPQEPKGGFGLGWMLGSRRGVRRVSHLGAVHGFTSVVALLPEKKLGVVVLCNDDLAFGPVRKLSNLALDGLLAAERGETLPPPSTWMDLDRAALEPLVGEYESERSWARVKLEGNTLVSTVSGETLRLRASSPSEFDGEGRLGRFGLAFQRDATGRVTGFTGMSQTFRRVDPAATAPAPASWRRLVGTYGPTFAPLVISVRHGHLYARVENEFDYRLTPVDGSVFRLPEGLYEGEQIVFHEDRRGRVHTAILGGVRLVKRLRPTPR